MIAPRDSPEGEYNKFLTGLEGHRGVLLATAYEGTLGVIRALTSSNKIRRQKLYLVREMDPRLYPYVVRMVDQIPDDFMRVK